MINTTRLCLDWWIVGSVNWWISGIHNAEMINIEILFVCSESIPYLMVHINQVIDCARYFINNYVIVC